MLRKLKQVISTDLIKFVRANYNHPLTLLLAIFIGAVVIPVASIHSIYLGAVLAGLQVCAAVQLTVYALQANGY